MTLLTATLRYAHALEHECSWRVASALDAIDVRVRVASAAEVAFTCELRYRRTHAQAPLAYAVHPQDPDLDGWLTESALFHPDLPRLALLLLGTPAHAASLMQTTW